MKVQDTIDAVPDNQPIELTLSTSGMPEDQLLDSGISDISVSSLVSQHSEEAYRMDRSRGKLVLICNTQFNAELKLKDRKGTDRDIATIKRVFRDILGFEVEEHRQLKVHQMLQEIATAARTERNKECDCFAVFILTHGSDSGKIFGTDKDILLSQLMEPLKNNDSLGGKPKMVFVQACRGKMFDRGQKVEVAESDNGDGSTQVTIPIEADFLYVYSTADGHVSFQNPNNGSWFVQALCTELEANWQRLEMMQMLTRVCHALAYTFSSYTPSNPETHDLKQISSVTTTLTKAIRFH